MIVIPMAGLSQRFTAAGYDQPKYMLPLAGQSVFAQSVCSFAAYFDQPFLFIARDVQDTAGFIAAECDRLGLRRTQTVILNAPTAGQAETVEFGLRQAGIAESEPITIFNIDTFRPGFRFPDAAWFADSAGYLEVFVGSGANWSNVEAAPGDDARVVRTAEKQQISNLCCTGLYHFATADGFLEALTQERAANRPFELYVAPLYNYLIAVGKQINYHVLPEADVIFCGVPAEYEAALQLNKFSLEQACTK